jgi:hypothetical protein
MPDPLSSVHDVSFDFGKETASNPLWDPQTQDPVSRS